MRAGTFRCAVGFQSARLHGIVPGMAAPPNARREVRPAGPAPTLQALREAALAHLARFAATEAGLVRVLDRRVDRWRRRAEGEGIDAETDAAAAKRAAREVARALAASGVVDDAAYAAVRARSLTRAGRSRRAIGAHLAAKGVPGEVARAAMPEPDAELGAALTYARRRRLGPFRGVDPSDDPDADAEARRREVGAMARAGFPQPVATAALRMDRDEAEALVIRLRQG